LEQLPVIDWDDFVAEAKAGKGLVAVAGVIHDVTDFIKACPTATSSSSRARSAVRACGMPWTAACS
jgi:stearoyl-CoA desaturase (delta-9 desaturase)